MPPKKTPQINEYAPTKKQSLEYSNTIFLLTENPKYKKLAKDVADVVSPILIDDLKSSGMKPSIIKSGVSALETKPEAVFSNIFSKATDLRNSFKDEIKGYKQDIAKELAKSNPNLAGVDTLKASLKELLKKSADFYAIATKLLLNIYLPKALKSIQANKALSAIDKRTQTLKVKSVTLRLKRLIASQKGKKNLLLTP